MCWETFSDRSGSISDGARIFPIQRLHKHFKQRNKQIEGENSVGSLCLKASKPGQKILDHSVRSSANSSDLCFAEVCRPTYMYPETLCQKGKLRQIESEATGQLTTPEAASQGQASKTVENSCDHFVRPDLFPAMKNCPGRHFLIEGGII